MKMDTVFTAFIKRRIGVNFTDHVADDEQVQMSAQENAIFTGKNHAISNVHILANGKVFRRRHVGGFVFVNTLEKICVSLLLWNSCMGPFVVAADFPSSAKSTSSIEASTKIRETFDVVEWVVSAKSTNAMDMKDATDASLKDHATVSSDDFDKNFEEVILSFEKKSKVSIVSENEQIAGLKNEADVNATTATESSGKFLFWK
jgi:hypothetical protein